MVDTPERGRPDDLMAGYSGAQKVRVQPTPANAGAGQFIKKIGLWALASVGALVVVTSIAGLLVSRSQATNASKRYTKNELIDIMMPCGVTAETYRDYVLTGDKTLLMVAGDRTDECLKGADLIASYGNETGNAACANAAQGASSVMDEFMHASLSARSLLTSGHAALADSYAEPARATFMGWVKDVAGKCSA